MLQWVLALVLFAVPMNGIAFDLVKTTAGEPDAVQGHWDNKTDHPSDSPKAGHGPQPMGQPLVWVNLAGGTASPDGVATHGSLNVRVKEQIFVSLAGTRVSNDQCFLICGTLDEATSLGYVSGDLGIIFGSPTWFVATSLGPAIMTVERKTFPDDSGAGLFQTTRPEPIQTETQGVIGLHINGQLFVNKGGLIGAGVMLDANLNGEEPVVAMMLAVQLAFGRSLGE